MGLPDWISRLTEIKCEGCGRRMKKIDRLPTKNSRTGEEFTEITLEQATHGERRAIQCQWCDRVWCTDCGVEQYGNIYCACGHELKLNQIAVIYSDE